VQYSSNKKPATCVAGHIHQPAYLLHDEGRQTTGQSAVGLQHFLLSLQSLAFASFFAFAFLPGFFSVAWADKPVTSMIAIMPAMIFFI
jgi:hypothetical protein